MSHSYLNSTAPSLVLSFGVQPPSDAVPVWVQSNIASPYKSNIASPYQIGVYNPQCLS